MDEAKTKPHKYKIRTDMIALSKVSDLLDLIAIDNIPIVDFDEKNPEMFITTLEMRFAQNPDVLNTFLQTITSNDDDFTTMDLNVVHAVFMDFFGDLPSAYMNTIKLLVSELKKQKDSAILSQQKAMEKAMMEIMEPEMIQKNPQGSKEISTELIS